jgi:hypothetical protein
MRIRSLGLVMVLLLSGCAAHEPAKATPVFRSQASSPSPGIGSLAEVPQHLSGDPGKPLVVFDIDDTLLTSDTFHGSDYWYKWQTKPGIDDSSRVPCLYDAIAMNYEVATQKATESKAIVALVNAIPNDKVILTSRNPVSRGATVRELTKANYALPRRIGREPIENFYMLKDRKDNYRLVSYYDGVLMGHGLHKGDVLVNLLDRTKTGYDRVVFVDDDQENIDNMRDALAGRRIPYVGLRYDRIQKPLPPGGEFVRQGEAACDSLKGFLQRTFPERLKRMEAGPEGCGY